MFNGYSSNFKISPYPTITSIPALPVSRIPSKPIVCQHDLLLVCSPPLVPILTEDMQLVVGYTFEGPRKVDLPESVLAELSKEPIESPLIFNLNGETHVGVRQFNAEESTIGVSTQLGLATGIVVHVEPVKLPKGTSVTFRVLDQAGSDWDWKPLLEVWLPKNITALTRGDHLEVSHLGLTKRLQVQNLEPEDAVCVTDTDMDLFIETLQAAEVSTGPREAQFGDLVQLSEESPVTLELPPSTQQVRVSVDPGSLVYIGPEYATSSQSWQECLTKDSTVSITGRRISLVGTGSVAVKLAERGSYMEDIVEDGTTECPTCGKHIPTQSFVLHSNFCARHTRKCTECGAVFTSGEIPPDHWHCGICGEAGTGYEQIHHDNHIWVKCECGFEGERRHLALHRAGECPNRPLMCRFCHLVVPQGPPPQDAVSRAEELSGHESECGSRTADCHICHKPVRLRSLQTHMAEHDAVRRSRTAPLLCSNQNCPQPADPEKNQGLCDHCFGPLYSPQYDPDGSRLRNRLERRYILQLTRGCGKPWCQNKFCRTATGQQLPMSQSMATVRDILRSGTHWFCVDEVSTRKAMFVNDVNNTEFARGWRGLAITRCSSESEAHLWLQRNASKLGE